MTGVEQGVRRFRLDIAYDGSSFNGWSKQPGLRTVQGTLEEAIFSIFGRRGDDVVLTVAGRTDTGVHATGQVAHLDITHDRLSVLERSRAGRHGRLTAAQGLERRVNGLLGLYPDVLLTAVTEAPEGFDARFSAVWRRYTYRLADAVSGRSPLDRTTTTWYPHPLDVDLMDQAAATLVGLHDFAAYCKQRAGATTIRTLLDYRWTRGEDRVLTAEVKADAFCHSMVRALVGACVAVGEGKLAPDDPARLRGALERTGAFKVMPARGLTLVKVGYPEDDLLAARAELTRARRTLTSTDEE